MIKRFLAIIQNIVSISYRIEEKTQISYCIEEKTQISYRYRIELKKAYRSGVVMVYAVDMVDTVYTILTAIQCSSSMYAYIYTVMTTRATAVLIIPQQKSWSQFCKISWKYTF